MTRAARPARENPAEPPDLAHEVRCPHGVPMRLACRPCADPLIVGEGFVLRQHFGSSAPAGVAGPEATDGDRYWWWLSGEEPAPSSHAHRLLAVFLAGIAVGALLVLLARPASAADPRPARDIPAAVMGFGEPDRGRTGEPLDPEVAQRLAVVLDDGAEHRLRASALAEVPGSIPGFGANGGSPTPAPLMSTPLSGFRAAPAAPRGRAVTGTASWYAWRPGEAAAGPALRAALGPSWRGRSVLVDGVRVRLTDWCACRGRLVDLDSRTFRQIAPLSLGLREVTVSW